MGDATTDHGWCNDGTMGDDGRWNDAQWMMGFVRAMDDKTMDDVFSVMAMSSSNFLSRRRRWVAGGWGWVGARRCRGC